MCTFAGVRSAKAEPQIPKPIRSGRPVRPTLPGASSAIAHFSGEGKCYFLPTHPFQGHLPAKRIWLLQTVSRTPPRLPGGSPLKAVVLTLSPLCTLLCPHTLCSHHQGKGTFSPSALGWATGQQLTGPGQGLLLCLHSWQSPGALLWPQEAHTRWLVALCG